VTNRNASQLYFPGCQRRQIEASFSGGHVTSDGGVLLLRQELDERGLKFFALYNAVSIDGGRTSRMTSGVVIKMIDSDSPS